MLSREENELLCRTGVQTPMGAMLRRYWIPALMSDELEAGGAPKRVRLLGENLVAFRDTLGRAGILDENCPHRGASLVLARNEECGLRCLYHGWKIDVTGRVLETPPEPDELNFKDKVRAPAFPVRESGGFVWTYLGPPGTEPALPDFEFTAVPAAQRNVMKVRLECNWVQGIEGVIDSAHTNYLHADGITPAANLATTAYTGGTSVGRPSNDGKPRMELDDTAYGLRYAAIRKPLVDPDRQAYVRVTLFVAPFYGVFPAPAGWGFLQAFVPIDDGATMLYYVQHRYDGEIDAATRERNAARAGMRPGIDFDAAYRKVQSRANTWLQDREMMRRDAFSGISGIQNQDMAVQESMGTLFDRTKEHLGTCDAAVIRMRRLMLESVRKFTEHGVTPLGLDAGVSYSTLRAEEMMVPLDSSLRFFA
jgi:phthalate 4,5-dioxygenase oxygenase subunit